MLSLTVLIDTKEIFDAGLRTNYLTANLPCYASRSWWTPIYANQKEDNQ